MSRSTGAKTQIVAVDGQPSDPFEPLRNQFPMGPGARFELMFDMPREAGAEVKFVLRWEASAPDIPVRRDQGGGRTGRGALQPRPPAAQSGAAGRDRARGRAKLRRRRDRRRRGALRGQRRDLYRLGAEPLASRVPRRADRFAFANRTAVVQAMRLGGHVARLLHSMDDGWEPYWRDTILIQPGRTLHVAFVADNPGKWPIESAIPEHRAAGVGAWFQVG